MRCDATIIFLSLSRWFVFHLNFRNRITHPWSIAVLLFILFCLLSIFRFWPFIPCPIIESWKQKRKTKTKTEQNEKRKKWKKFSFLCVTEGRKVFKRKRRSNLKKESDLRVSFSVVHYLRQCRWLHLLNLSTPTPTPPPTTTTSHFKHHLH